MNALTLTFLFHYYSTLSVTPENYLPITPIARFGISDDIFQFNLIGFYF